LVAGRRLAEVDPLNDQPFRVLALAWSRLGRSDSASTYQAFADSGLTTLVTVTQFAASGDGATFGATVRNRGGAAVGPMTLRVDFLGSDGTVLQSADVPVPALEAAAFQSVTARATGQGIVAWRYKRP